MKISVFADRAVSFKTSFFLFLLVITGCTTTPGKDTSEFSNVQVQSSNGRLREPRHIFSVTQLNSSEWLILGGHLEKDPKGKISNSAEILQLSKQADIGFHPINAVMRHERWGHRATSLKNGDVLICGGSDATECEKYSLRKKRFFAAGHMVHARSASAQIILPSGNILITGGYNKGDPKLGKVLSSAEVFDFKTNIISLVGNMSAARAGHGMFQYKNNTYLVGGLSQESAVIEVFNEAGKSFSKTGMQLPYGLKDFQSYQDKQNVYLFGGTKPDGNSIDKVLKIDLLKQSVEELPGRLLEPREDISICINQIKNKLLVFGGEIKGNERNGTHSGMTELISFEPFSVTPTNSVIYRDDAQTISLPNGECLVIGGTNAAEEMELSTLRVRF